MTRIKQWHNEGVPDQESISSQIYEEVEYSQSDSKLILCLEVTKYFCFDQGVRLESESIQLVEHTETL